MIETEYLEMLSPFQIFPHFFSQVGLLLVEMHIVNKTVLEFSKIIPGIGRCSTFQSTKGQRKGRMMMEVILKNIDEFVAPVNNTLQGKVQFVL